MKVFIAGATGGLGRLAVTRLTAAGHDVTGIARTDRSAALLDRLGATPARLDLFDDTAVTSAVAGHEVVMNLATRIPTGGSAATRKGWVENERLRRDGSRILVDAALAGGATRFVQESICFSYADHGADWITEDAALEPLSLNAAMVDAEDSAARFTAAGGNGVVLRFGQFVQPESPMTQALLDGAAKGRVPLVGRPDAYQSMVDVGDAAAGVVAALDAPAGTYNVCEERPATRAEHLAALEAVVGHRVRMLPRAAAMVPVMAFIARSQRVSSHRFVEATGWRPTVPAVVDAWPAVARAIAAS
ncbi:NAD-dependent epimerase/dehydratase [Euzebya pacifica]|uniref:NAD-dependent epimerase/dehydratase n=1 Tax=Euzebya pacifica TaxID=1608957 RepID=A0A346XX44_9ACTN|nr:NAD(P)-dependent oxidoreductase [Euzebya pacifica]AXV06791.1 NAD-dependent epimerase/dehydratase [Euzebya pacifica]